MPWLFCFCSAAWWLKRGFSQQGEDIAWRGHCFGPVFIFPWNFITKFCLSWSLSATAHPVITNLATQSDIHCCWSSHLTFFFSSSIWLIDFSLLTWSYLEIYLVVLPSFSSLLIFRNTVWISIIIRLLRDCTKYFFGVWQTLVAVTEIFSTFLFRIWLTVSS